MLSTSVLTVVLALAGPMQVPTGPGETPTPLSGPEAGTLTSPQPAPTRWVLDAEVSQARFLVREQLAGFDFPNDAVGVTSVITGTIVVGEDGAIASDQSEFRVDLTTLRTDNERRDGYVQRRTLETEQFPEALLVPKQFQGLEFPLATSGLVKFQIVGDLTLHGVTRQTTWEVTAQLGEGTITGQATTAFPFEVFGISVPSVARVLSVDDNIRLELDFKLTSEG